MYRDNSPPNSERPPSEFVYQATDASRRGSGLAVLQLIAVPLAVSVVLTVTTTPTVGLIGMIGATLAMIVWWRHAADAGSAVLRVDAGFLCIVSSNGKTERA